MDLDRLKKQQRTTWVVLAAAIVAVAALKDVSGGAAFLILVLGLLPALGYALILGVRIRRAVGQSDSARISTLKAEKPVWAALACAAAVVAFDVFVAGQGIWSWAMAALGLLYFLPRALLAARNRAVMISRGQKAALLLVIGVAGAWLVRLDVQQEEQRAAHLVTAVHRYEAARGEYPKTLSALVPQYLPQLPGSRRARWAPPLQYVGGAGASLTYVVVPPFGRKVYHFKTGSWIVVD